MLRNVVGEPGADPWVPTKKERRAEVTLPSKELPATGGPSDDGSATGAHRVAG